MFTPNTRCVPCRQPLVVVAALAAAAAAGSMSVENTNTHSMFVVQQNCHSAVQLCCLRCMLLCPAVALRTLQLLQEPITLMTVCGERATGLLVLKQNSIWQFFTHSRLLLMLP
jgi:hypothetical protein